MGSVFSKTCHQWRVMEHKILLWQSSKAERYVDDCAWPEVRFNNFWRPQMTNKWKNSGKKENKRFQSWYDVDQESPGRLNCIVSQETCRQKLIVTYNKRFCHQCKPPLLHLYAGHVQEAFYLIIFLRISRLKFEPCLEYFVHKSGAGIFKKY